jgi:hypothetical protein
MDKQDMTPEEKARIFYEENREEMELLEKEGFPFVRELRLLAGDRGDDVA